MNKDMCPQFNLSAPGGVQRGEGWAAPRPGPRQGKGGGAGIAAQLFMETPAQQEPATGAQEALSPPRAGGCLSLHPRQPRGSAGIRGHSGVSFL